MLIRQHLSGVEADHGETDIMTVARCVDAKQEEIMKDMKKKINADLEQLKTFPIQPYELQARLLRIKNKSRDKIRFARDWYSYSHKNKVELDEMLSKWGADFDKNYYLKITELNDKAIVKNSSFGIKSLFETIEKNLDLGNVYDISTSQTGFE